jgi:hypothetical protein
VKLLVILILFYSNYTFADSLVKLSNLSVGFSKYQGRVATGGIKVPTDFNIINFKLNLETKKIPDYYLGLEINLLKNEPNFSAENALLVLGFKSHLKPNLYGNAELKYGWGFMKDQGTLYQRESFYGHVFGASMGINYLPDLPIPLIIGFNINWLHQVHGEGFWGRQNSSDTVIDQFGPMLILGYKF